MAESLVDSCSSSSKTGSAAPPDPSASAQAPSTTAVPQSISPEAPAAAFDATVSAIDSAIARRMEASWRPGCPVPLGRLRLLAIAQNPYLTRSGAVLLPKAHRTSAATQILGG